jgi:hypothetical protein
MKNEKKIAPKKYTKKKAGRHKLIEFNFSDIPQKDIARLFNVTPEAVCAWDCPRLANGLYDAIAVLSWYIDRLKNEPSARVDLENEKLKLQCEKLQLEINDQKRNTIPIQEHRDFLRARAADMKSYFLDYAAQNLHPIAMQPVEVIQKHWRGLVANCFNSYVKAIS